MLQPDDALLKEVLDILPVLFYLAALWLFGRMADNLNRIRKLLEEERRRLER